MKKILALILSLVMALSLVACGNSDDAGNNGDSDDNTIKVGLICIGDENDQGYTYNFMRGKEAADAKLKEEGINVEWIIKYNLIEGDPVAVANEELAEEGCAIIFNNSYGHEAAALPVAANYPEIEFVAMTGDQAWADDLDNTHNAFANIYEGRYVAGVAAGLKLQEMINNGEITADQAVIGYVGAYSFAEVVSGYTAYYLGAKSVCPSVTMKVQYVNSWSDATAEANAAAALCDLGCVLISQHSDNTTPATTAQSKGAFHTGYNNDMSDVAPEASIIGTRIDWTNYFVHAIKCVVEGKELEQDWCNGMAEGEVVMTELNTTIAATDTQETIDTVIDSIKDGSLNVFDTSKFTVGGQTVSSYTEAWGMNGAEVIDNGVYAESTIRSAPYFDLRIDGIEELNA